MSGPTGFNSAAHDDHTKRMQRIYENEQIHHAPEGWAFKTSQPTDIG